MKHALLPMYFVRSCRRTIGFSQAELAELLGVSRDVVANWETGRTIPRADVYITLKMVLTASKNVTVNSGKAYTQWKTIANKKF